MNEQCSSKRRFLNTIRYLRCSRKSIWTDRESSSIAPQPYGKSAGRMPNSIFGLEYSFTGLLPRGIMYTVSFWILLSEVSPRVCSAVWNFIRSNRCSATSSDEILVPLTSKTAL
ncbi:unnamed protein product [Rotaria socialis]|uniref:Uncharacterized protein n=1 Tax=Rotaria socialis TaxID=392032 RepID=A0A817W4W6_9BILA|nr:unnamed protein product [Rotaria socialis]CAF3351289.1 unnamed protein product [Rotaria socialis]